MPRHWLRFAPGRALGAVALALSGLMPTPAPAQSAPDDATAPARHVRADDLVMYVEFDGLDAHAEAWQKTAAYKILSETPTGAMLEDLLKQVLAKVPTSVYTPDEIVLVAKHLARSGFVAGLNLKKNDDGKEAGALVVVVRKAFTNKDVRPIVARLLQRLPNPGTKTSTVTKSGHKMVTGMGGDTPYFWWVEESKKEDVVFVTGPVGAEDYMLEALDGKKPTMQGHPTRDALRGTRDGFERTGLAILDIGVIQKFNPTGNATDAIRDTNIGRIDLAWGFQGDALMSVTRLHPIDPSKGSAATGVAFERSSLPVFPTNSSAFMAFAANLKALPALLRRNPQAAAKYDGLAAELKSKAKVKLDDDVFGQLGPKVMAYIAPSKASESGATAGAAGLAGLARLGMGMGGGPDVLPRFALLVDVANPTAFGKTLDELMNYANREIKAQVAKQASAIAAGGPGGPGGPGGGRGRGGPGGPPAPEFRPMSGGEGKSYTLFLPPEMAKSVPSSFRPTIRLGAKQLAIGVSADAARQALEGKGSYAPPAEIAESFNRLPSKLNWLLVLDPRGSAPEILAALPGKIQASVGTVMALMASQSGQAAPAAGAMTFSVDPSKLPSADAIRKLLYPSVYTIDKDGDAIRITARAAFPPVIDPQVVAGGVIGYFRGQAMQRGMANGGAKPRPGDDGLFDVPRRDGAGPTDAPPGGPRRGGRPIGRPGGAP